MKRMMLFSLLVLMLPVLAGSQQTDDGPGWVSLFDGKTLDGWKASQFGDKSFTVQDGAIVANGQRFSHLYYVGKVKGGKFENFEFKADVLTRPNSNGGIYFHTRFQPTGWPELGFEVQVNNTFHRDRRRTGSLYQVQDYFDVPARDHEWFTEHIIVRGTHVVVKVDGVKVVDWREPDDWPGVQQGNSFGPNQFPGRKISSRFPSHAGGRRLHCLPGREESAECQFSGSKGKKSP